MQSPRAQDAGTRFALILRSETRLSEVKSLTQITQQGGTL
jgi:hypothetical protein